MTCKGLRCRSARLAAIALLLGCAASAAAAADAPAHAAALQSCPKVSQEIADLDTLEAGLKRSDAVGLIEKLRLKSAIEELIGRFKAYHRGSTAFSLDQLQEQYDVLMMRIAGLLQDKDAVLHGQLCNAWESIWATLQDRSRFMEKLS